MLRLATLLTMLATPSVADTVVASRMLRPQTIITAADLTMKNAEIAGGFRSLDNVIGKETRNAIYPGRPVLPADIGQPALVDRNQIVTIIYDTGGLSISTDGRALGRGGKGDRIRVMNLTSRATITGSVQPDGTVRVP